MAKKDKIKTRVATKKNKKSQARAGTSVLADPRMQNYDRLLRDPCSSALAHPPYAGTDAGYLIRTVDRFVPNLVGAGLTPGTKNVLDAYVSIIPSSYTANGFMWGCGAIASSMPVQLNDVTSTNFIGNSFVKRFRPVAACVKWVPTGPYADRQGSVGLAYSVGQPLDVGNTSTANSMLTGCTRIAPNGSEMHEVRWLPSAADENFSNASSTIRNGGAATVVLSSVDAVAASTTSWVVNGYVEVTGVWEWTPSLTGASGIAVNPQAPLPYTTQQLLATIGNMGDYIFRGVRSAGYGAMVAGAQGIAMGLTRGVQTAATRGPALRLTY